MIPTGMVASMERKRASWAFLKAHCNTQVGHCIGIYCRSAAAEVFYQGTYWTSLSSESLPSLWCRYSQYLCSGISILVRVALYVSLCIVLYMWSGTSGTVQHP